MVVVSINTRGAEVDWVEGGNPVQPPPKGLEPVGDSGWYQSPEGLLPGDAQYCEYNEGSPVCGGQPFTPDAIGIEAEVNIDPCGFTAKLGGSVAFVKVPEKVVTYRKPGECRREYEQPPPIVPPPPLPGVDFIPEKARVPRGYGDDEYVYVVFVFHYFSATLYYSPRFKEYATATNFTTHSPFKIQHPSTELYNGYQHNYGDLQPASCSCWINKKTTYAANETWVKDGGFPSFVNESDGFFAIDERQGFYETNDENSNLGYKIADGSRFDPGSCNLFEGRFGDIFFPGWRDTFTGRDYTDNTSTDSSGQQYAGYVVDTAWMVLAYIGRKPPDKKKRPPPLNLDEEDCCVKCCTSLPQPSSTNDDLLRQILAECKLMNKSLGSSEFPAMMPSSLHGNSGQIQIPNMARLLRQKIIYDDQNTGEYPVKIKIEDTDAAQSGNQSETMEFLNAAELAAEQFGVLMNLAIDTNTLVQLATKNLIETGVTRKQVHNTQSQVEALIKHQGFAYKEKFEEVPFSFSVPKSNKLNEFTMADLCKESTQKIEVIEYQGKTTYVEDSAIIRHMHGILKAVFFRGVAKSASDVGGAIAQLIRNQNETIKKVGSESVDDIEAFATDFETGFTSYTGHTDTVDPSKPYDIDYTRRPRVKIIRKPTTDNPGAGQ